LRGGHVRNGRKQEKGSENSCAHHH
jgi:hypothetical protein